MRSVVLLVILFPALAAADDRLARFLAPHLEAWRSVEAVVADAADAPAGPATGVFPGEYGTLHLGRDGKAALVSGDPESGRRSGILGSARVDGPWLMLTLSQPAIDPEGFAAAGPAEIALMLDAWEADAAEAAADGSPAAEDAEASFTWEVKLLAVAHGDGWLLIEATHLPASARRWDGEGPMTLEPSFWSASLDASAPAVEGEGDRFVVADPLAAALPEPLKRMLHRAPIDARIVEILDAPADLEWRHQSAELRVRIDRGSRHGVYEEMLLFGTVDQQGQQLAVQTVAADHAVATLRLTRFHPTDPTELPALGGYWISRTADGGSCPLDFGAPVRAQVATAPVAPAFDDEGYAWIVLRIDQGAAHGLAVGDRLFAEDYAFDGEGRVSAVRARDADVLWRIVRYMPEMEVSAPVIGTALVTPAWRRAAFDLFGSMPAVSGEPIEAIVD